MPATFSPQDLIQIQAHGLSTEELFKQIESIRKGPSFVRLSRPCTLGDGVRALSSDALSRFANVYQQACQNRSVLQFIPASGAASRMFQDLLAFYYRGVSNDAIEGFFSHLEQFAFYEDLRDVLKKHNLDIESLQRIANGSSLLQKQNDRKTILKYLLFSEGLDLVNFSKALIKFHRYGRGEIYTAFEEQMTQSSGYLLDSKQTCRLHFTISDGASQGFQDGYLKFIKGHKTQQTSFNVDFSIQDPATDTLTLGADFEVLRDTHGRLIFRPGGHGALLKNLNALQGDLIFISNIDNIAVRSWQNQVSQYRQVLGGILVEVQQRIFGILRDLSDETLREEAADQAIELIEEDLGLLLPDGFDDFSLKAKVTCLKNYLHRPIRVCGMVRNEGAVGGGPFWLADHGGFSSPQIIETSQVDQNNFDQKNILRSSHYFNPVDMVCGVRDHKGEVFNLFDFADQSSYIVTQKTKDGETTWALERPGLWNGGMAKWNSIFVEIPLDNFNPVKTVYDLLKKEHQGFSE